MSAKETAPIEGWYSRDGHWEINSPAHNDILARALAALGIDADDMVQPGIAWFRELLFCQEKAESCSEDCLEILGMILCEFLSIQRDCSRDLADGQTHYLIFFTNQRVLQVYCAHNPFEQVQINELIRAHSKYKPSSLQQENQEICRLYLEPPKNPTYHQATDPAFAKAQPFLAWSSHFPDGIDMEALSPRDPNAHRRIKDEIKKEPNKAKSLAPKAMGKEKDHPPPPKEEVHEPPSSDNKHGSTYKTGRLLGKGGFAICHEGTNTSTGRVYALKIVKSHMPQKKMEQKVFFPESTIAR